MKRFQKNNNYNTRTFTTRLGFTIVELLIVVVVIGILAAITIVSFGGITGQANTASLQSDLDSNSRKLQLYYTQYGAYPTALDGSNCPSAPTVDTNYCLKLSSGNTLSSYTGSSSTFTLKLTKGSLSYQITPTTGPTYVLPDGTFMQNITSANCPSSMTRAVDARDNHTYWVQKLADNKCWMLTNLGYSGGGTNTYGDVKTLTNGTGGSMTYTVASYYVVPSTTNFTTEPTAPSTSTNGTGQYGYLYNWCGAMGGQVTAACANGTTPVPVITTTICPSGWRLPTSNGGEFTALNNAINSGSTATSAGLRSTWLAQYGGVWDGAFSNQGSNGWYWSSSYDATVVPYYLQLWGSGVNPTGGTWKSQAIAVRCLAN